MCVKVSTSSTLNETMQWSENSRSTVRSGMEARYEVKTRSRIDDTDWLCRLPVGTLTSCWRWKSLRRSRKLSADVISEMTYTVSSGTLNSTIPYKLGDEHLSAVESLTYLSSPVTSAGVSMSTICLPKLQEFWISFDAIFTIVHLKSKP